MERPIPHGDFLLALSPEAALTLGSAAWAVTLDISVGNKIRSELNSPHDSGSTLNPCYPYTAPPLSRCHPRSLLPDLVNRGPPCLGTLPVSGCQLRVLWSNFGLSPGLGVWTAPGKDHRSSGLVSTYCTPGTGLEAVQALLHLILHTNPVR